MEELSTKPITVDNEPHVYFNALSDLRIFGVKSEDDGEMIFEIAGYDLQIKFNRDKVKSVEEIEGVLEGIKDVFRKLIIEDLLSKDNDKEKPDNE